jgi:hypothetical protein
VEQEDVVNVEHQRDAAERLQEVVLRVTSTQKPITRPLPSSFTTRRTPSRRAVVLAKNCGMSADIMSAAM